MSDSATVSNVRVLPVTIEVRSASEQDFVLAQWRSLETRLGDRSISCSADWTETWLDAFGDLVPHRFVLAQQGTRLCGICLITEGVQQTDGPVKVRSLHVGTAGEPEADSVCVEYNRLLVEPACRAAFSRQLVEYLSQQRDFDQWNLDGFSGEDLAAFEQADPRLEQEACPAHYVDLDAIRAKGCDLLAALKHEPRRKVKKGLQAFEGVRFEWAESIESATDVFGELIELHQARWQSLGKPGVYSSERFVRFHEGLIARLVPSGRMAFARVTSNRGTVGCLQFFVENKRALIYQCGWAPSEKSISPGVVVDYLTIEACLSRGFVAYDFLSHATQHKKDLTNASVPIVWARHRRPRVKFFALHQARKVKRYFEERKAEAAKAAGSQPESRG